MCLGEQQHGYDHGECYFGGRYGYVNDNESDLYRNEFNDVLTERPYGKCNEMAMVIDE